MTPAKWLVLSVLATAVVSAGRGQAPPGTTQAARVPVPPIVTALGAMPGPDDLATSPELPDVLQSGGRTITTAAQWMTRREEMKRVLSYYAVGLMPPPPGNVKGTVLKSSELARGTVSYRLVRLSFGAGRTLGFDVAVFVPASAKNPVPIIVCPSFSLTPGAAPLPTMLRVPEQGKGLDALALPLGDPSPRIARPADDTAGTQPPPVVMGPPAGPEETAQAYVQVFRRGYGLATYHYQDAGEDTIRRREDGSWAFRTTRFFPAYPRYDWGLLGAWAWSVSRVIDYLETQPFAARSQYVAVGHSRIGKAVLIAGAFDERIAVSAPAGSGAGGTGAYRFNGATSGAREGLDDMMRKYPNWFSPHLHQFAGRVERLPFDQHWFMALTAPRGFIALEGTEDQNCLPIAVKAARDGALPAYTLLNAPDAIGVNYAGHRHELTAEDWTALLDFADVRLRRATAGRRFDVFPMK